MQKFRTIWIVLFFPLLALTTTSDKPCKPLRNKHKQEKFINSLSLELVCITNWDSAVRAAELEDSIQEITKNKPVTASVRGKFFGHEEGFYTYIKSKLVVCKSMTHEIKKEKYVFNFIVSEKGNVINTHLIEGPKDQLSAQIENILIKSPVWLPSWVIFKFIETNYKLIITVN